MTDEFGNDEHAIRLVAIAAHARGDFEAERIALDRLALMERQQHGYEMHGPDDRLPTGDVRRADRP